MGESLTIRLLPRDQGVGENETGGGAVSSGCCVSSTNSTVLQAGGSRFQAGGRGLVWW